MSNVLAEGDVTLRPGEEEELTTTVTGVTAGIQVALPVNGVDIGRLQQSVSADGEGEQSIILKREGGDDEPLTVHYQVFSGDV